jgi:hypothetical protein
LVPVTVVSLTITAALPLSQTSTILLKVFPLPEGGSGLATLTCSDACSTLLSSMSTPG